MTKYFVLLLIVTLLLSGCRQGVLTKPDIVLPPPEADFTAAPTRGVIPLTVTFHNQSKGTITRWHWDFGDGQLGNEPGPVHTYTSGGIP